MLPLALLLFACADASPPTRAATARAVWLADVQLHNARPGRGRFVFVPQRYRRG
jgi:hypothetical protein